MKKTILFSVSIIFNAFLFAQSNQLDIVEKGNIFTLGNSTATGYQYIDLPRMNTIIKRGAIANYKALEGKKVIVTEVLTKDGTTDIILKRKDGLNFFRYYPTVKAKLEKAILKGELIVPFTKRENSLAQQ